MIGCKLFFPLYVVADGLTMLIFRAGNGFFNVTGGFSFFQQEIKIINEGFQITG